MSPPVDEFPESTEELMPRPARQRQRWPDAVARRKLETLREQEFLRKQLTEVWDKPGYRC